MTPSALVLLGGPKIPDGPKLRRHGIKRLYYEGRDPNVDRPFADAVRGWGFEMAVMCDPGWPGYGGDPVAYITRVNKDIARLGSPLSVMLDLEMHDSNYILGALREFKRTNAGRNVAWTCEYHQGGWMSHDLTNFINSYPQCRVIPQLYLGSMDAGVVDSHAAAMDLADHGVLLERIAFFYNLRFTLPMAWDGVLYLENWGQLT